MTARNYNLITHSCMLTALFSAILFDKAPRFKWLILGLGVLSGVVAAAVYFYSQWVTAPDPTLEDSKSPELSIAKIEWHRSPGMLERDILTRMLSIENRQMFRIDRYSPDRYFEYQLFLSKNQQEDFNKRIAHALAPLYSSRQSKELELECVVTRAGNFVFIVRPANRIGRASDSAPEVYFSGKKAHSSGEWLRPAGAGVLRTPHTTFSG
jgi:hypothetical protein